VCITFGTLCVPQIASNVKRKPFINVVMEIRCYSNQSQLFEYDNVHDIAMCCLVEVTRFTYIL
jgi:hypothetical protein